MKRSVYKEWYEDRKKKSIFIEAKFQHPDAAFVAFSKGPFGEGAERFAYRFFEVGRNGSTIVGPALVAKESMTNQEQTTLIPQPLQTQNSAIRSRFAPQIITIHAQHRFEQQQQWRKCIRRNMAQEKM